MHFRLLQEISCPLFSSQRVDHNRQGLAHPIPYVNDVEGITAYLDPDLEGVSFLT
jgi:hypothetical protein